MWINHVNYQPVLHNTNLVENLCFVCWDITLLPGSHPVRARCRPLNPLQEQDLKIQLDEWLTGGVIEPSVSPWASALVPCKKKGTSRLRWSIDFRSINDRMIKDSYPLPCIETNLHMLAGAKIFSSLDSAGVPLHPDWGNIWPRCNIKMALVNKHIYKF